MKSPADMPRVSVAAVHALFDTRVANHMSTLLDSGFRVTYVNWSETQPLPQLPALVVNALFV